MTEASLPPTSSQKILKKRNVLICAVIVAIPLCIFLLLFFGRAATNVAVPLMAGNLIYYLDCANGAKSPHSVKDYMVEEVRIRMAHHWEISDEEKWWYEHLLEPDVARACKQAWSER